MLRRKRVDININHERWLISYADFVTLLFCFFVVMYSVSYVNEEKYQDLSQTLEAIFSSQENIEKELEEERLEKKQEIIALPKLANQFVERLADLVEEEAITVTNNEFWLQVSLNNRILFPLGSVSPSQQAEAIFSDIADMLKDYDNPIQVEGFTDNLAINTAQFPSNWELSTARASSIVKLLEQQGIHSDRLAAVGYGENHPIADNQSESGRGQNRRVVLMIGKYPRQRPAALTTPKSISTESVVDPLIEKNKNEGIETMDDSLTPVILKNGEHLFSSDPDLPRN